MPGEKRVREQGRGGGGVRPVEGASVAEASVESLLKSARAIDGLDLDEAQVAVAVTACWMLEATLIERVRAMRDGSAGKPHPSAHLRKALAFLAGQLAGEDDGVVERVAGFLPEKGVRRFLLDGRRYDPPLSLTVARRRAALSSIDGRVLSLLSDGRARSAPEIKTALGPERKGGPLPPIARAMESLWTRAFVHRAEGETHYLWAISPSGRAWIASRGLSGGDG